MRIDPKTVSGRIMIDGVRAGTAWRVSRDLAITAAHCLIDDEATRTYHERCEIVFADGTTQAARRDLDEKLDVAVLTLQTPGTAWIELASLPWDDEQVTGERKLLWEGYGYPDANPNGMSLHGSIVYVGDRETQGIELSFSGAEPLALLHASGAPIIVRNRAVAFLSWHPEQLQQKVLYARPIDQVARKFSYLKAPLHSMFRPGNREEQPHLRCDRTPQWGEFREYVDAKGLIRTQFIHGPDREVPGKFIERIERVEKKDYQVRSVTWPGGIPPTKREDWLACLSRSVTDEELPERQLVDLLLELATDSKLVIHHPIVNLSLPSIAPRLPDLCKYHCETLPGLFKPQTVPASCYGIVFVQPVYWEPNLFQRWFPRWSAGARWETQCSRPTASPTAPAPAPALTPITPEHVKDLLAKVPSLSDEQRLQLINDVRRYKTSREILDFLKERIG